MALFSIVEHGVPRMFETASEALDAASIAGQAVYFEHDVSTGETIEHQTIHNKGSLAIRLSAVVFSPIYDSLTITGQVWPYPATSWWAQTDQRWIAVVSDFERHNDWYADTEVDEVNFPHAVSESGRLILRRPIWNVPNTGVLVYANKRGDMIERWATEIATGKAGW